MIKVALISHSSSMTGAEKMLFSLGKQLSYTETFYPVILYPGDQANNDLVKACEENGLESMAYPFSPWYIYENQHNAHIVSHEMLHAIDRLSDLLRTQDFDAAVCNTLVSLVPVLAAYRAQVPSVLWVHGILDGFFIDDGMDLDRRILFDRINMALSTEVVCCSHWVEDYYRPICESSIRTITNWSEDPDFSHKIEKSTDFICLNTFDSNKGVSVLLKAAKILREKHYSFTIDLYGTGGEETKLKEFVSAEGLEKNVWFRGRTNEVDKAYEQAFCLVNPSDMESFGLTITEAMSHSLPVIAVGSGGPKELVEDGITGFLISPRDEKALAEKMAWMLDHHESARKMGESGRKRYLEHFTPQKGCEQFTAVLMEAISAKRTGDNTLLEDTLLYFLRQEGMHYDPLPTANMAPVEEKNLCFSGELNNTRSYNVTCQYRHLQKVAFLTACHDQKPPCGILMITLLQKGELLSETRVDMKNLPNENWAFVPVNAVGIDTDKLLTIRLTMEYQEESGKVGVYEDRRNRSFLYKVFNKLGHPLPGRNALIVRFTPGEG